MSSFWEKLFKNQPLKVTMLGPSGVGKTSMLASMYDQFDTISQDLQLQADEETESILDKRLQDLKSMVGDSIKSEEGLAGTAADYPIVHEFHLGEIGAKPVLEIHFQDYPGGWIDTKNKDKDKIDKLEKVKTLIRESAAIVVPIDAARLMEKDGKYHNEYNKPDRINDLLKTVYENLDFPRLVILAPVKCEKYMQDDPSKLFKRVKEGYSEVLNRLNSEKLLPKVAVVITPVQTVGNIIFSRIEENEDDQPTFCYRRCSPYESYQPKDTEIPLKVLLSFLVKLHLDKKQNFWKNRILSIFSKNASLRNAVSRFSYGIGDKMEIVQGNHLLR
jgi:GTPase SAR1 family protein